MTENPSIPQQGQDTGGDSGQPTVPATNQPDPADLLKQVKHWKGIATGSQGYIDTLKREKQELLESSGGLSTQLEDVTSRLSAAEKLASERAAAAEGFEQSQKALELLNLLMKPEYRHLQEWYAEGLLRTDGLSGEPLTEYLNKVAGKVTPTTQPGTETKPKAQGVTPPAPPGQSAGGMSFSDVQAEMGQLLNQGKTLSPRYQELQKIFNGMVASGEHKKRP